MNNKIYIYINKGYAEVIANVKGVHKLIKFSFNAPTYVLGCAYHTTNKDYQEAIESLDEFKDGAIKIFSNTIFEEIKEDELKKLLHIEEKLTIEQAKVMLINIMPGTIQATVNEKLEQADDFVEFALKQGVVFDNLIVDLATEESTEEESTEEESTEEESTEEESTEEESTEEESTEEELLQITSTTQAKIYLLEHTDIDKTILATIRKKEDIKAISLEKGITFPNWL
ncbi:hypothetical protein FACS1894153_4190 [Bacteroidia bacterium]|nr:hypothetical protein FACS1894153_4190 [Bacteroidia bacterium]